MSAPAAKAFSEPVMTMAPIPASASNSASTLFNSSRSCLFRAFSAWGRFSVMRPTRSRLSTSRVW
jgi:hypothetical protein